MSRLKSGLGLPRLPRLGMSRVILLCAPRPRSDPPDARSRNDPPDARSRNDPPDDTPRNVPRDGNTDLYYDFIPNLWNINSKNPFSISCHSNHHSSQHIFNSPPISYSDKLSHDPYHIPSAFIKIDQQTTTKYWVFLQSSADILFPGKQQQLHQSWFPFWSAKPWFQCNATSPKICLGVGECAIQAQWII